MSQSSQERQLGVASVEADAEADEGEAEQNAEADQGEAEQNKSVKVHQPFSMGCIYEVHHLMSMIHKAIRTDSQCVYDPH